MSESSNVVSFSSDMQIQIQIPTLAEEITLEWLNLVMNPHDIQVDSFIYEGDAKDGRGYLSSLNRVKLQVLENTDASKSGDGSGTRAMSIIIKGVPTDVQLRDYIVRSGYCQNELQMYTKVLPDLKKFLDSRNVPEDKRFKFPVCYYGAEKVGESNADYKFILVLEDLTASSFHPWAEGAMKSFDWDYTVAALKEIALFHSNVAAMKIFNKYERLSTVYPHFLYPDINDPTLDHYIKSGFQTARDVLFSNNNSTEEEQLRNNSSSLTTTTTNTFQNHLPEGLIEHLNYLESKFKEIVSKALLQINLKKLNVIRHGDLHCNNVFFRKGDPVEAKWIDFQACAEGEPMLDLSFFLSLSCEPEFSTTKLDETLLVYYDVFMEVLREAKIDFDYSFEKLKEDFKYNRLMSILHIISGAPVWCCGPQSNSISRDRLRTAIIYAYNQGELEWIPN